MNWDRDAILHHSPRAKSQAEVSDGLRPKSPAAEIWMLRIEVFQLEVDGLIDHDSDVGIDILCSLLTCRSYNRLGQLLRRLRCCMAFVGSFTVNAILLRELQGR